MRDINITYNAATNELKVAIGSSADEKVNLNDINFYITKTFNETLYCLLMDSKDNVDILYLEPVETKNRLYNISTISLNNKVHCKNDKDMKLALMRIDGNKMLTSNFLNLDINSESFATASDFAIAEKIAKDVYSKYQKIYELTELNIQISKDILEAAK